MHLIKTPNTLKTAKASQPIASPMEVISCTVSNTQRLLICKPKSRSPPPLICKPKSRSPPPLIPIEIRGKKQFSLEGRASTAKRLQKMPLINVASSKPDKAENNTKSPANDTESIANNIDKPTDNALSAKTSQLLANGVESSAKKAESLACTIDKLAKTTESSNKAAGSLVINLSEIKTPPTVAEKPKPKVYFPDGSILKALLMAPLSFKNRLKNGIYQNGSYSTFRSDTESPLRKVRRDAKRDGSKRRRRKDAERVSSTGVEGSRGEGSGRSRTKPCKAEEESPKFAEVTVKVEEEMEVEVMTSYDDPDECIPSLNVEVELEIGEGVINSQNIDYFYNGDDYGDKDHDSGEVHENWRRDSLNKGDEGVGDDLQCKVCGRQFNFKKNMNKHLRHMHGIGRFRCAVCPLEFEKRRDLIQHRDSHSESGEAGGGFKCETCGKVIQWYNHFVQHRRTHSCDQQKPSDASRRRHVCNVCEKGFRSAANLRAHERTHTGERPFPCTVCGVSFAQKRIQMDHMNKHTGERPYECQECGDKFSNYITYNVHKRTRHTSPEQRMNTFPCTSCPASFVWRSNLVAHMRTHSKEKVYRCPICNKCFSHRNSLSYHVRCHCCDQGREPVAGQRPEPDSIRPEALVEPVVDKPKEPPRSPTECDVCGKRFAKKALMMSHRKTHSRGKDHQCCVCGSRFVTRATMARHVRNQHAAHDQN